MTDTVLYQTDDSIDEEGLAAILDLKNSTQFVESGMGFNVDFQNDQVTIGTTTAWGNHAIIRAATGAYHAFPDQKTVNLATSTGVNYVFVRIDPTTDDDVSYHIDSDDTAPADPSLKIGTIDAGAETSTELNRDPDASFGDTTHDSVSTGAATIGDIIEFDSAGEIVSTQLDSSTDAQRIFPDQNNQFAVVFVIPSQSFMGSGIVTRVSSELTLTELDNDKTEPIGVDGNGRHTIEIDGSGYLTIQNTGTENTRIFTFIGLQF